MHIRSALIGLVALAVVAVASVGQPGEEPGVPPEMMKAVRLHAHSTTNEPVRFEDVPTPSPEAGQVLIRVHAASVIAGDWKLRDGYFGDLTEHMPFVMGFDVSGVIDSVGEGVEAFAAGDEVFGYLETAGAFAEYAVALERNIAIKPAGVSHVDAAGAPVSALAAWYALVETAQLKEGQTVFIQGGAGGVGHYAVQIAHALGATVYATASPRNHDFLREIGADTVIDYNTQRFEEVVDDVDVVLDTIGGEVLERCYQVVKPGGYLASLVSPTDQAKLDQHGIRGAHLSTPADGARLAEVAKLMEAGTLRTHVSRFFELSEAAEAIALSKEGHTRGKIVIKVR